MTQRHRHTRLHDVIAGIRHRMQWRGVARELFGDVDSRCRARLDDSFHQQQVVGANHGVAGYRQLFGQPPRRRQPRAGPDPRAADRFAKLIDHLRRQRLWPGPIQENGNLHVSRDAGWLALSIHEARAGPVQLWVQHVNFDGISADVSRFVALSGLAPSVRQKLDPSRSVHTRGCPVPMQVLPETLHCHLSPEQPE